MGNEGSVFEGKTLEAAVRKGLETLGLTRAEAKISVLEEGSGGFLGLGARPFRVNISARPGGAPADSGRDGRRDGRRGGRSRRGEGEGSTLR